MGARFLAQFSSDEVKAALRPAEMQNSSSADAIWLAAASVMFGLEESYLANKISEAFGDDKGALRRTPQYYVELRKIKNMVGEGCELSGFKKSILRLKARLSMNRNEPTATDVSRAAVDVDMEALGAEKTKICRTP